MANVPGWFIKEQTHHLEDGGGSVPCVQAARHMARENAALCSHRFKSSQGQFDYCHDCSKQLFRAALPRRTGKTARKVKRDDQER